MARRGRVGALASLTLSHARSRTVAAGFSSGVTCAEAALLPCAREPAFLGSPAGRAGRWRPGGSRLRGTCRHVRRREHAHHHHHPRGAAFFSGNGGGRARGGGGHWAGRQGGVQGADGRPCPATPGKEPHELCRGVPSIDTCRLPYL